MGGTIPGAGNRIAHNATNGVVVDLTAGGVTILSNEIFANGALGIDSDFDGVSLNGSEDPDVLPPFPTLANAAAVRTGTAVEGTIDHPAGRDVRIEFFASSTCDNSGHGEGKTSLGALTLTAPGGQAAFGARVAAAAAGQVITATATDLDFHRTSEFSRCLTLSASSPPRPDPPDDPPPPPGREPGDPPGPGNPPDVPGIEVPPVLDDPPPPPTCEVPKLKGVSAKKAERRLKRAGCKVGKIKKPRRPTGKGRFRLVVKRTSRKAGSVHDAGTRVGLTLRWVRVRSRSG